MTKERRDVSGPCLHVLLTHVSLSGRKESFFALCFYCKLWTVNMCYEVKPAIETACCVRSSSLHVLCPDSTVFSSRLVSNTTKSIIQPIERIKFSSCSQILSTY